MIVYGDPQFRAELSALLEWILKDLHRLDDVADPEALRGVLIRAGQIEQAVADDSSASALSDPSELADVQALTDTLATAFYDGITAAENGKVTPPGVSDALQRAREQVVALALQSPLQRQVTVKVPEGFEFYALFPEQYALSTKKWLRAQETANPGHVLIVGIRGIGTTLSALVNAVLRRAGWDTRRVTVRPAGHPFARAAALDVRPSNSERAMIVDEGPGLSGSSMASVAAALVRNGFALEHVSFLPGHAGEPGPAASPEVLQWWAATPRFTTTLDDVRWQGLDLSAALGVETARLCRANESVSAANIGGGQWRASAYAREGDWPAVNDRFERPKYLCRTSGAGAIVWKFTGLGAWVDGSLTQAQVADGQLRRLARQSEACVVPVLGFKLGFSAMPWLDGVRLDTTSADERVMQMLARYVAAAAGPALSAHEHSQALQRLEHMVAANLDEACGGGERVHNVSRAAGLLHHGHPACYGDGRLAPAEWVRTATGQVWKTDFFGHVADHTIVGKQSVLWDVAGVLVEWDFGGCQRVCFLNALVSAGIRPVAALLTFYELAYAAFRLGQTRLCRDVARADSAERRRLDGAQKYYQQRCETILQASA